MLAGAIAYNILTDRKDIIKPVSYTHLDLRADLVDDYNFLAHIWFHPITPFPL